MHEPDVSKQQDAELTINNVASADTALFTSAKKLQYWTGNELFILA
jgi:hypothetical protein